MVKIEPQCPTMGRRQATGRHARGINTWWVDPVGEEKTLLVAMVIVHWVTSEDDKSSSGEGISSFSLLFNYLSSLYSQEYKSHVQFY